MPTGVTTNVIPPVTIAVPPGQAPGTASPTGLVFNSFQSDGAFTLSDGSAATFLFATEDGTISGWNAAAGSQSIIAVNEANNPADGDEAQGVGAVYKGLAMGGGPKGPVLFAANFRRGTVDMYDQNFNLVKSFTDHSLPSGFAPFNVQVLDNKLFVTFAQQNAAKHDDVAGAGNGFVDEFDLSGPDGKPITIGDLWAITPGNGGSAGSTKTIYFTAGVQNEMHGLFGSITPNVG